MEPYVVVCHKKGEQDNKMKAPPQRRKKIPQNRHQMGMPIEKVPINHGTILELRPRGKEISAWKRYIDGTLRPRIFPN